MREDVLDICLCLRVQWYLSLEVGVIGMEKVRCLHVARALRRAGVIWGLHVDDLKNLVMSCRDVERYEI